MSPLPRLLASLCCATALVVVAPAAADAAPSFTFSNGTTVQITDPGPSHDTVHMTVTSDGTPALADTKVFLGGDGSSPYSVVGTDGVRDARYADGVDSDELSTADCAVYDGSEIDTDAPVTVAGSSFSVDLPKGEEISFESTGVAVGAVGTDPACAGPGGYHGLAIDYADDHETIDGFSWDAPAAPLVAAAAGRRQVTLSFDRARGTSYDVYPVVGGVRSATAVAANIRGNGSAVPLVLDADADGQALEPGTTYAYQVQATRLFNVWDGSDMVQPSSPFSAVVTAATNAQQTVRFGAGPAPTTTDTGAQFSWTIDANIDGDAPFCLLDVTDTSATEVPCTTSGATLSGLAVGVHTLSVYPSDGEGTYPYTWTVVAAPVTAPAPAPAPVLVAPKVVAPKKSTGDLDHDGIANTWLIAGKPAPAPHAPKAVVSGGKVKLKLKAAPRGATHVRVYRADGKGKFKAVKTLTPKAKSYTDTKVKPGHTYTYKVVAVNAKGQQSAASKATTAKVAKRSKKH